MNKEFEVGDIVEEFACGDNDSKSIEFFLILTKTKRSLNTIMYEAYCLSKGGDTIYWNFTNNQSWSYRKVS